MITSVIIEGDHFKVYGGNNTLISSMPKLEMEFISFNDEGFHVKNGIFIETYDINCNKVRINNVLSVACQLQNNNVDMLRKDLIEHRNQINNLISFLSTISQQHYQPMTLFKIVRKINELIDLL